ncbi:MAG: DUF512 domain-containing protein [Gemmatimonadota bacterium]|nr:DUF512 domain-containing protein [Gemmatimonadota bacterium]MDH3369248.1 DUF512 domain-containing protein [Gemmatimonadota bacterium]MDH5550207.1 DUF512 domain-containing protein [Gemmatimonadota bacterium]
MVRVQSVAPHSLGAELGLTPGTVLLSIGGCDLEDFLDWEFHAADERFLLTARTPDGELIEYDIERPEDLPLGVELEPPHIRRCANRCDFCFVDGLPEGLRSNLYIRDDDYRLSFRYGNFATLTNLKPRDEARIFAYRLSPLYVSVHATDPVLRRRILRHPRAPAIIPQLERFAEHGITVHTQIVLQPGVNDGSVLIQSLEDLYGLGNAVLSVSVVPVGLTEFSKHHLVREPTAAECRDAIAAVREVSRRAVRDRGVHWAYGSDDLYLVAGEDLPPAEAYDGFEQVENGVGAVRFLQQRLRQHQGALGALAGMRVGLVTGTAMGRLMPLVLPAVRETSGADLELLVVENALFGSTVTSAGLLPGAAFVDCITNRTDLDLVLLPAEAVNDHGTFLDDLTIEDLRRQARVPFRLSYDFVDAIGEITAT